MGYQEMCPVVQHVCAISDVQVLLQPTTVHCASHTHTTHTHPINHKNVHVPEIARRYYGGDRYLFQGLESELMGLPRDVSCGVQHV